ncbi:MAG: LamG-like jellyroll fold domain-containing protein [Bacteroidota bacterium]
MPIQRASNCCLLLFFLALLGNINAQTERPRPSKESIASAPAWAQEMYSENPNVNDVDRGYQQWRKENPIGRTYHTQFYKHWRRAIGSHVSADGFWVPPTPEQEAGDFRNWLKTKEASGSRAVDWEPLGPFRTFAEGENFEVSWQVNIYSLDQSLSDPNVLYAGTENGLVFKSIDGAENWTPVSHELNVGGIRAVKVHPTSPDIAFFGERHNVYKTTDGGDTWELSLNFNNMRVNDISINTADPNIVMVASERGLHRSTDGGEIWTQDFVERCWDMEIKTDDPNTVFLLKTNPGSRICEFFKSTDQGETWEKKANGWIDPAANSVDDNADNGARLAVTDADPNRLYAVLIGQYNDGVNDNNFLGVYRSDDAGESWTLPNANANGGPGGPYAGNHTCLVTFWFNDNHRYPNSGSEYNQGFYNLALDASDTDPDKFLVGFLNMFKSEDGGATFDRWGGYGGGPGWQHPDIQDIDIVGENVWVSSDGGLNKYLADFSSHQSKAAGIAGSDFWGFDGGWNEDVMTGGRYHNGNSATIYGTYADGDFIRLGGAEATTGYVHPAGGRRVMHSDINPKVLPLTVNGPTSGFSFTTYPNEGYAGNNENSSEIEPDPRCYNHLYIGNENRLEKSLDGGISWETLATFGTTVDQIITGIEVSRSNPNVLYVVQNRNPSGLFKSTDGGQNFTQINPPVGAVNGAFITLDPLDENHLWLAWNRGGNDVNKVFESIDGGNFWTNISSPILNSHHIEQILHIGGTDGGVYLATNLGVFYKSESETDWLPCSEGLPARASVNRLVPFYAKQKVRMATYGRGIWQSDFYETPTTTIVQPTVDKLVANCARDTFYFDDYSMVDHDGATWDWSFDPAPQFVSAANVRNPKVVFGASGDYTATMTLNGVFTKSLTVSVHAGCDADHVPGNALRLDGESHAAALGNLNLNSNTVTITCWVKADPVQKDRAVFVFARGGTTVTGIGFDTGLKLSYHWDGGQWWWDTETTILPNQWTHIALVVTPTAATVYANGVGVTNNVPHAPEAFDTPLLLGWDPNSNQRRFTGLIDEVTVWDKALTTAEVRELMHLTKVPADHPNLVSYYQFNEMDGQVLDRISVKHLSMTNSATRTTSTAPLGGGISHRLTVDTDGNFEFGETGVTVDFETGQTLPDGEVVVSRIDLSPDQLPNASPHSEVYWIINNYGENEFFDPPVAIRFEGYGNIEPGSTAASDYSLYGRETFADGDNWFGPIDFGDILEPGANSMITFADPSDLDFFGQYVIMQEGATPVEWLEFQAALQPDQSVRLFWTVEQAPGVDHFIIEKSRDGVDFQYLTKINVQRVGGVKSYQSRDASPFRGENFYRLRQIDQDGKEVYSAVRSVVVNALPRAWNVFPNPIAADEMLQVKTDARQPYLFRLFNADGKLVLQKKLSGDAGFVLNETVKGAYLYEVVSENGRSRGSLIVK